MARTDVYERILDELANGELEELECKIFHFLRRVYPPQPGTASQHCHDWKATGSTFLYG